MVKLTEDMVVARSKGSELNNIKKLNCWGSELSDVSVVKRLTNVEVLSLSVNKISTLEDFEFCSNLQELYIRKNNIKDINDVLYLRQLPKLKSLWLNDNPCAEFEQYRLTVLRALPHLQKLDNVAVEPEEVQKALVCGIPLPKEPYGKRSFQTSLPYTQAGQSDESYLNESTANSCTGSSPIRDNNTFQKSNSYSNSLDEGYDYSKNLYDEDDEQVVRRKQSVDQRKCSQVEEPTYVAQTRTPNQEMYRRSYADYEDEKSSVASSQQATNRRQSYSGVDAQSKAQFRQASLKANIESQAENDYDNRPYVRLEYGNAPKNLAYSSRDDPFAVVRNYNSVSRSSTSNFPLSPDCNKNNRNEPSEVSKRIAADQQPEMAWSEEYSQKYEVPPRCQQSMDTASFRSGEISSCQRTFNSRPKSKNANLLSAVLCLIKELDFNGLEVTEMAIHRRMDEMED